MSTSKNGGGCAATKNGFHCTRDRGHAGRHEARGINGMKVASWPRVQQFKSGK